MIINRNHREITGLGSDFRLFGFLVELARFMNIKDQVVRDFRDRPIIIPRGSVLTTLKDLSEEMGLNYRSFRIALAGLVDKNVITTRRAGGAWHNFTLITIPAYDELFDANSNSLLIRKKEVKSKYKDSNKTKPAAPAAVTHSEPELFSDNVVPFTKETRGGKEKPRKKSQEEAMRGEENTDAAEKPKSRRQSPKRAKGALPPYDEVQKLWNENRGSLPEMTKLTTSRKRLINARISEEPDLEYWASVVKRLSESPFCTGDNDRGWRASFDFCFRADKHVQIMEGAYDGQPSGTKGRRRRTTAQKEPAYLDPAELINSWYDDKGHMK